MNVPVGQTISRAFGNPSKDSEVKGNLEGVQLGARQSS